MDRVIKWSHWEHDSTPSEGTPGPPSPGDFQRSPEVPDTWAYCLHARVLSQNSKRRTRKIYSVNPLLRKDQVPWPAGSKTTCQQEAILANDQNESEAEWLGCPLHHPQG